MTGWVRSKCIYSFDDLIRDQLKAIKKKIIFLNRIQGRNDFSLYNEEKLNETGKKPLIQNLEKPNRGQFINRLNKVFSLIFQDYVWDVLYI